MKKNRWQEVTEIYHAALELPENERATFLKTCEDEEVRQEVLSLLKNESKSKRFLEEPALEVASRLKTEGQPALLGRRLGSYNIISELGAGGMGEVYRARDPKLDRDVAIKVLPEKFAHDHIRISRFHREAKLLAAVNHSNIASIYGLEESDGIQFLVLELVEGETLSERLKRGPIPAEDALKLALQITQAFEAAHERGIIHRDLKPANIKITPNDEAKILDFGLARAFSEDQENLGFYDSPSLSAITPASGIIFGTAFYMSPEQARGRKVDKRTDIWAFGCVFYEMLTGHPAFPGEDVAEIISAVIKGDADMDRLPDNIHPRMREVVARCLQKDLKKRYRDIGDVRFELEQVIADPNGSLVQPVVVVKGQSKLQLIVPWVAATIFLTAIITGVMTWYFKPILPTESPRVSRLTYVLPENQQLLGALDPLSYPMIAISPDGSHFVYNTYDGLYLRSMNQLEARLIPGTEKLLLDPSFSPDGQWIAYMTIENDQGRLEKISISGSEKIVLCNTQVFPGVIWDRDDTIIYSHWHSINRVSANGGTPEVLVEDSNPYVLFPSQLLPDGTSLLFTRINTLPYPSNKGEIVVCSLETGDRKVLIDGLMARYLPTGHLVYRSLGGDLNAVPFDLDALEVVGEPATMIRDIWISNGVAYWAVSDTGTLIYIKREKSQSQGALVWVDWKGKEEAAAAPSNAYTNLRFSPDGTKVALSIETAGNTDIWVRDLVRKTMMRLTFDNARDDAPIWTPDGKRIAFASTREGYGIYWISADGSGGVERLVSGGNKNVAPQAWTSDGSTLIAVSDVGSTMLDIQYLSMEDDHELKPLLEGNYMKFYPQLSPDGRWMAYVSDESGQFEVYIRPFPDVDGMKSQVSTNGGCQPTWSRDGRELFYRGIKSDMHALMTVSVETEPALRLGRPRILFRSAAVNPEGYWTYDISPDGKRFLMIKPLESTDDGPTGEEQREIIIVQNWFEELKERVPVN